MSGQLWINKKDFTLHRIVTTYRFEKIFLITYDITYQNISDKVFPSIVKKTKYNFNPHNKEKSEITISSIAYFDNINTIKRKNYRKKHMAPWYTFSENYDKTYWSNKKIEETKYINGLAEIIGNRSIHNVFEEGSKVKEYNKNLNEELVLQWESQGLDLKKIMKEDLKL